MYLLFDIGGTKMRLTTSEDGTTFGDIRNFQTPAQFEDIFGYFSEYKENSYEAVIGGLAGVLDKEKSVLTRAPNLQLWVDELIKKKLEEFFETQVFLENDAGLAGLGEACFGAGRDKKIVAYLTVGTGVGGARIVDGKIDTYSWGFEPGKQIIDADLTIWPESVNFNPKNLPPGSIESYISGAAINYRFQKPPSEIKDAEVWTEVEKLITVMVNNTISYWSPEVIVLGGGLILEGAVSIDNIKSNLEKNISIFPELPEIKTVELGDASALYGALSLIKNL